MRGVALSNIDMKESVGNIHIWLGGEDEKSLFYTFILHNYALPQDSARQYPSNTRFCSGFLSAAVGLSLLLPCDSEVRRL